MIMKGTIAFVLLSFSLNPLAFSQDDYAVTGANPFISPVAIWADMGVNLFSNSIADLDDFRNEVPQSSILQRDFSEFKSTNYLGQNSEFGMSMTLGWEFRKGDTEAYRERFELRTGVSFSRVSNWDVNLEEILKRPGDTLVSSVSGNAFYIDSVNTKSLRALRYSSMLHIDVSSLWRTNPAKDLQGFLGAGLMYGVAYRSQVDISYTENIYAEMNTGEGYPTQFGDRVSKTESEKVLVNNPMSFTFYFPVGFSYCLNKKSSEIRKKWHLTCELRRGLTITNIPGFGSEGNDYTTFRLGVRYRL